MNDGKKKVGLDGRKAVFYGFSGGNEEKRIRGCLSRSSDSLEDLVAVRYQNQLISPWT